MTKETDDNELKDTHYHAKFKHCKIEAKRIKTGINKKGKEITEMITTCLTHNIKLCRCGWEFKWHYGTNSKLIK